MLSRIRRQLRKRGLRGTLELLGRRAAGRRERFVVLLKRLETIREPARTGSLEIEDLAERHLQSLRELNRKREDPAADSRFADYLRQGFHGFVAFRDGEAVGYYWWVDRDGADAFPDLAPKLGLGIELADGDVYGSDFYLLEDQRGGGAAGEFLYRIESSLRERGYTRLWGYVASENRPARWTYSTRGYEPMWIVDRRRVLLFKRTARAPVEPGAESR